LKIAQSEDLITVSGIVENTGGRIACEVVVSFTVTEARGAALATRRATPEPATIPPGHRSPFSGSLQLPAAFQQDPTFRLAEPTAQVIAYTRGCQS
jgi:hypothetical protein